MAVEGAGLAVAAAAEEATPVKVVRLSHTTKAGLCLARAPWGVVWKAANVADKQQEWVQNQLRDDAGIYFDHFHSGETMTIGHVAPLLPDPDYYLPDVLGYPARWEIKKDERPNARSGEQLGAVVLRPVHVFCVNAMQNGGLEAKVAPWEEEVNDEAKVMALLGGGGGGDGHAIVAVDEDDDDGGRDGVGAAGAGGATATVTAATPRAMTSASARSARRAKGSSGNNGCFGRLFPCF